ncbi:uncharacterized protein MELLADRAFT_58192 [Melampsora larici-populina 98AG31]|uniref:Tc1-like transposase DDE domain-containing protein n=1 Tax=Melampsora larici-populina (strain 98AG31 / pathotype 3-4-7) TaxID=747676 RepID=F4SC23_MELLP|nr:uncharacterized protein MELLADRAFT_58192 [Melampsora larici-populina 98AG31]EGF97810.1 hypothetical protein MELLADRAFT_58192 [Melampsora larici-populina 98AG31]
MENVPAEALVFTDESAICERDLMRVFGRSPSGKRVTRWIKRTNAKRYSLLPAIGLNGMLAMTVREGSIDRKRFETFLEFQLLPAMNPFPAVNSVLVMDNARIHHGGRIAELCEERGV